MVIQSQKTKAKQGKSFYISGELLRLAQKKFKNQNKEIDFTYWLRQQLKKQLERL